MNTLTRIGSWWELFSYQYIPCIQNSKLDNLFMIRNSVVLKFRFPSWVIFFGSKTFQPLYLKFLTFIRSETFNTHLEFKILTSDGISLSCILVYERFFMVHCSLLVSLHYNYVYFKTFDVQKNIAFVILKNKNITCIFVIHNKMWIL